MDKPLKRHHTVERETTAEAGQAELTLSQQELLCSLERSSQQVARGETRPVGEFLEELRLEREAESNDNPIVDGIRSPDSETP